MKILVDNAISPMIARELGIKGYDAVHVRELGMAAASDSEILKVAEKEDRIIISADTDFGTLLALQKLIKPSFILFRQSDKRPISQLKFLVTHLPKLNEDLLTGSIVVVEDERIRIRALPIY